MREVAAEFERPVLLFSGGKDSIVMLALAERAFAPAHIPFPVMHIDTGHNFPEVLEFRDRRAAEAGTRLIVASVQDSIDAGRVVEETGRFASRNRLQTTTLLDALAEHQFDAVFGGARRDEEKARAKERVFSFRDEFGQWDPKNQRPELWNLYNTRIHRGEHIRVFPLSNWTELDIWQYIGREGLELPSIYFAHQRQVFERDGILLADFHWHLTSHSEILSERIDWTNKFRYVHTLLFIIGIIGVAYFFFPLMKHWFWLSVSAIITFLYSAPKIPQKHFRALRKIAIGKTIFLAFVWMYATTILPIIISGNEWPAGSIVFIFNRFFLIYCICILFDYRDRMDDKRCWHPQYDHLSQRKRNQYTFCDAQ